MSKTPLIAIVDDDESVGEAIQELLKALGFAARLFLSAEAFLQFGRLADVGCLITDFQLPGMSGLQLQNPLAASGPPIPIIVITAFPDDGWRALHAGAICFLSKPVVKDDLLACLRLALDRRDDGEVNACFG